jgi:hypothetical protein
MKTRVKCLNVCTVFLSVAILAIGGLLLLPLGAWASHKSCDCLSQICSAQGFEIELTDFNVNQDMGTSSWTYQVCREALGFGTCGPRICDSNSGGHAGDECSQDSDCQPPGGGVCIPAGGGDGQTGDFCTSNADCEDVCHPCAPAAGLGKVEVVLPGLGECITDAQTVTIEKVGGDGTCTPAGVTNQDSQCPDELCAPRTGGKFCVNGPTPGIPCQTNGNCGSGGTCSNIACQPVTAICTGGLNKEEPCSMLTDCPDIVSMDAACTALTGNCVGGADDGMQCTVASDCTAPGFCSKLDVLSCANATLDSGDCIELKVTVAGEIPTLGPGTIDTVTRSMSECAQDQICGPACACEATPPGEGCLTRSKGFYGNHPNVTDDFLNITVCGKSLSTIPAGYQTSVTEALCSNPNDAGKGKNGAKQSLIQLEAQLAAAKLNFNASDANDGDCSDMLATALTNAGCQWDNLADIESNLCCADQKTISDSKCIEGLTNFNVEQDTFDMTPSPFDHPGSADPSECKTANGNAPTYIMPVCPML